MAEKARLIMADNGPIQSDGDDRIQVFPPQLDGDTCPCECKTCQELEEEYMEYAPPRDPKDRYCHAITIALFIAKQ